MFNALQPNFAWSVPENDVGTINVEPGGTAYVLPGATAAVLVPAVVDPPPAIPVTGVTPAGAPPPPPESVSYTHLTLPTNREV